MAADGTAKGMVMAKGITFGSEPNSVFARRHRAGRARRSGRRQDRPLGRLGRPHRLRRHHEVGRRSRVRRSASPGPCWSIRHLRRLHMKRRRCMVQSVAMDPVDPVMLWEEFGPPLRGFLARRVPPGVDADDLVQDVFLRVSGASPASEAPNDPKPGSTRSPATPCATRSAPGSVGMAAPTPSTPTCQRSPTPRPTAPRKPNSRRASRRWSAVCPSPIARRSP